MKFSRASGFTLLEAMIVLVVVGVVAAISLDMLTGQAKAEARRQMVSQQATEMATINRAVTEWASTASGLPTTAGQIQEVNLADVITAGRLPERFARRPAAGTNNPVSPIGQPYRAFVRRTTAGGYEVVVVPLGAINSGFAARAGIQTSSESLRTWNVAVMQQIREKFTMPSGVINAGTSTVDFSASGFSLDLAAFLGGNAANMTVAAFSNFAQLQTTQVQQQQNNQNSFIGKTCRAITEPCSAGEKEASTYRTCSTWGLHRQSGLPHQPVGEVFVTPIGNIQITKTTSITNINAIDSRVNANPPRTAALNGTMAGAARIARYRSLHDWQGTYIGYAVDCRHPNGTEWECVPWVSSASGINITNDNLAFNMSPMQSQIVSGSLLSFGPGITEHTGSRELIWDFNHFNTSNWRRTGERAACSGSVRAVASPVWTQDLDLRGGWVGWGGDTSGMRYGIAGAMPMINIGVTPAYSARFNQGEVGPATRLTYFETTQIPGQSAITTVCEENVFSNAASVSNPRTSGWAGASIAAGTNACPTSSLVARFGGTNYTLMSGRAYETFQFRPADSEQPVIRICCK